MNPAHKQRVKKLLSLAGVQVRPSSNTRPLDLTGVSGINPIAAVYHGQGRAVLVRVPLGKCLHFNLMAFPTDAYSRSPFIKTLRKYVDRQCETYADSPLKRFYETCRPRCAADLLGINNPTCNGLLEAPPAGAPLFWRPDQPDLCAARRKKHITIENRQHGAKFDSANGDQFYGPVSTLKGLLEFERLIKTFESIKSSGFIIDHHGIDNIYVICLFSAERKEWKCMVVSSGQHRISALAALEYEEVVLQILPEGLGGIVSREDAEYWPTVRQGLLSRSEAESLFDRVFNGEQPEIAKDWYCAAV